jgi:hypothetical protein
LNRQSGLKLKTRKNRLNRQDAEIAKKTRQEEKFERTFGAFGVRAGQPAFESCPRWLVSP